MLRLDLLTTASIQSVVDRCLAVTKRYVPVSPSGEVVVPKRGSPVFFPAEEDRVLFELASVPGHLEQRPFLVMICSFIQM